MKAVAMTTMMQQPHYCSYHVVVVRQDEAQGNGLREGEVKAERAKTTRVKAVIMTMTMMM